MNSKSKNGKSNKNLCKGGKTMLHHYITKYKTEGKQYAESWLQINIFGFCYCFSRRRIEIK